MLENLIGSPSILPGLRVVDIFPVCQYLALPAVEGPGKDDFVFTATAVGSCEALRHTLVVGHPKFESYLLLGEAKCFGRVFDFEVDLVWGEHFGRHDDGGIVETAAKAMLLKRQNSLNHDKVSG